MKRTTTISVFNNNTISPKTPKRNVTKTLNNMITEDLLLNDIVIIKIKKKNFFIHTYTSPRNKIMIFFKTFKKRRKEENFLLIQSTLQKKKFRN